METDIKRLQTKVNEYKEVLQNTHNYRQAWRATTKEFITNTLKAVIQQTSFESHGYRKKEHRKPGIGDA